MNKQDRVKHLVEAVLNEVKIVPGYFYVITRFTFPSADKEWEVAFIPKEIIHLDFDKKVVRGFSPASQKWTIKDISIADITKPQNYSLFLQNVRKLDPMEVKNKGEGYDQSIEFVTTVKDFPKAAESHKLQPATKVNIKAL